MEHDPVVRPGDFQFTDDVAGFLESAETGDGRSFPDIEIFIVELGNRIKAEADKVNTIITIERGRAGHHPMFDSVLTSKILAGLQKALQKPAGEWKVTPGSDGKPIDVEKTLSEVRMLLEKVEAENRWNEPTIIELSRQHLKDLPDVIDYIQAGLPTVDMPRFQMLRQYAKLEEVLLRPPTTTELRTALSKENVVFHQMDTSQFNRDCRKLGLEFLHLSAAKSMAAGHRKLTKKLKRRPTAGEFRSIVRNSTVFRKVADWPEDKFIEFWKASGLRLDRDK